MKNYLLFLFLISCNTLFCQAQTPILWGMTGYGGTNNIGTIFKINATDSILKNNYSFSSSIGASPGGNLTQTSNGLLYGLTANGGSFTEGTLFSYNIATAKATLLHSFGSQDTDGQNPGGSLIQASDSLLYGLTIGGGSNVNYFKGVIFSYNISTGKETIVHNFGVNTDGQNPQGSLIEAQAGALYGMSPNGGYYQGGNIFRYIISTGTYDDLYEFCNCINDALNPEGTFVEASDGFLYGMSEYGGTNGIGTIFSWNLAKKQEAVVYSFKGDTDGDYPQEEALIQVGDSLLYGMTPTGGPKDGGVIFTFNIYTDSERVIYDFDSIGGRTPYADLVQVSDSLLYGTTNLGGTHNLGTIFGYNIFSGRYSVLHNFSGSPSDGANPFGNLIVIDSLTPVWPGDANDDLTVNNYDLLPIGLYYGETGPIRDATTNTWAAHPATDWDSLQSDGYNKKYVDCNGDGTINSNDTLAITLNYGDTHLYHAPRNASKERSVGVPLYFIADSNSYQPGSKVHVAVWLGTSTRQAAIYGLGYDIVLDISLIQPGTLLFNYDSSFIGKKNFSALALTHISNDVETAVVGTNHTNKTGYGKIGDLYFTLSSSIKNPQFLISVLSSLAIDSAGNSLTIQPAGDTVKVNISTGVNQLSATNNQLSIYPNPTNGEINITSTKTINTITITDLLGQVIYKSSSGDLGVTNFKFQLTDDGMYFVTVTSNNQTSTSKVVVSK